MRVSMPMAEFLAFVAGSGGLGVLVGWIVRGRAAR